MTDDHSSVSKLTTECVLKLLDTEQRRDLYQLLRKEFEIAPDPIVYFLVSCRLFSDPVTLENFCKDLVSEGVIPLFQRDTDEQVTPLCHEPCLDAFDFDKLPGLGVMGFKLIGSFLNIDSSTSELVETYRRYQNDPYILIEDVYEIYNSQGRLVRVMEIR